MPTALTLRKTNLLAVFIVLTAVTLAVASFWHDSVIVDEVPHIGSGYSYLKMGDMRLNPEHPPLAKDIGAFPLLFVDIDQNIFESNKWKSELNSQWYFGRDLIFYSGADAQLVTRLVKSSMLIFFVLSAVVIFRWSRHLHGNLAALLSLGLFSFSPTVLAHSRIVATDIPALFGILLSLFFFTRFLRNPSITNVLISSIALGIALLTKFSVVLVIPFILVVAILWGFLQAIRFADRIKLSILFFYKTLLIVFISFIFIVGPIYSLHVRNYPINRQKSDTQSLLLSHKNVKQVSVVNWLSDKPILRAYGHYGLGLTMVMQRASGGGDSYFLGEVKKFGSKMYFPIIYFIKEPIAWWIFFVLALISFLLLMKKNLKHGSMIFFLKNHLDETVMLLWLLLYWTVSIKSPLNIGVRHLLPIYPFAIILVGSGVAWLINNSREILIKKILLFIVILLVSWYGFENIRSFPHYISYFNQTVGGPSGGYRYVVDSNVDWGQDLKRLGDFLKRNDIDKIELDYFGWADPAYYFPDKYIWSNSAKFKDSADFIFRNQSMGWLAVSAQYLQTSGKYVDGMRTSDYNWLAELTPEIVIGNSIFIYRIQ